MSEVDAHLVRVISVEAHADPRSVRRVLRGELVRSVVRARVAEALERHGIEVPPRREVPAA